MEEKVVTIKVKEVCGEHCVGVEDGESLFKHICSVLKTGSRAILDFANILTITSSFLNAAIGRLFGQFKESDIEKSVSYVNLDESDKQLVQLVINNAKEHFRKNPDRQETENKIVERSIEEQEND